MGAPLTSQTTDPSVRCMPSVAPGAVAGLLAVVERGGVDGAVVLSAATDGDWIASRTGPAIIPGGGELLDWASAASVGVGRRCSGSMLASLYIACAGRSVSGPRRGSSGGALLNATSSGTGLL